MQIDSGWVAALASVVSALVITVTAIAAFVQIRHARNANEITVYLRLVDRIDSLEAGETFARLDTFVESVRTDPAVRAALLDSYRTLPAYPHAKAALTALRAKGIRTAILSNGEPKMLESAVTAAGIKDLLDAVISVDLIKIYKPSAPVYALAERTLGIAPGQTGFVSSNAWDAQGAAAAGFQVFWCNRGGNPAEYGLDRDATEIGSLADLEAAVAKDASA